VTQDQETAPARSSANVPNSSNQPSPATQPFELSDEIVRDVLTNLQRGMETHNIDRILDVFDAGNMPSYSQFHDQMVSFLLLHDSIKFRYQLLQVSEDKNKDTAFAIADINMDAAPSDILPTEQRRSTQMRFQLKRGAKGWKVIGLRPANFFSQ
jgi:hypothetical protein